MENQAKIKTPIPEDKVCFNCQHMLWQVGLGQGVKCNLTKEPIPSRWHTCGSFEKKDTSKNINE